MITASEAKELASRSFDEKLEALGLSIKKAAESKKRSLRTVWDHKEDPDLWQQGGYDASPEWTAAAKKLEELGYKVSFKYEEFQFVDMYTLIEW